MTEAESMTIQNACRAALAARDTYGWSPEVDEALEKVRAALAGTAQPAPAAVPADPWQPIETAPKSQALDDGRIKAVYFLAFCPDSDATDLESCVCVCWWEPLMNKRRGQWYGEGMYPPHPTHWLSGFPCGNVHDDL